jgi:threonine synthase
LYVRYDLGEIRWHASRDSLIGGPKNMWRYAAVLPDAEPVTLGEGFTPLLPSRRHPNLFIKDEGLNPTGSFKARGMAAAITMLRHYGVKKLAAPSAGNAGGALATYAAAAGLESYVFMPKDVPIANRLEVEAAGSHLTLVDGLISDCGRMVAEHKDKEGWFDVSTLKEPFRVEGKKTMGFEAAEQMGWKLPDAILYPTGGGVGLIGMWKAFDEMEALGWIEGGNRPKMICVQAEGCAPIPKALQEGAPTSQAWPDARTLAAGLRVPKAYGDFIILDIVRKSGGTAVAVTDDAIMQAVEEMASEEGIFPAPEGAAALAGYQQLLRSGFLRPSDKVVLFNTGSGYKYLDVMAKYWGVDGFAAQNKLPASRNMGGIIGPA